MSGILNKFHHSNTTATNSGTPLYSSGGLASGGYSQQGYNTMNTSVSEPIVERTIVGYIASFTLSFLSLDLLTFYHDLFTFDHISR